MAVKKGREGRDTSDILISCAKLIDVDNALTLGLLDTLVTEGTLPFYSLLSFYSLLALKKLLSVYSTMVKLIREGRKKFGYASKGHCGSIIDAKIKFPSHVVRKRSLE